MEKPELISKLLDLLNKEENPDSIEFGTPSKGGALKVYGDFSKPDDFKKKIDFAFEVREHAKKKLETNQG